MKDCLACSELQSLTENSTVDNLQGMMWVCRVGHNCFQLLELSSLHKLLDSLLFRPDHIPRLLDKFVYLVPV